MVATISLKPALDFHNPHYNLLNCLYILLIDYTALHYITYLRTYFDHNVCTLSRMFLMMKKGSTREINK